jgi:hypothetical protein
VSSKLTSEEKGSNRIIPSRPIKWYKLHLWAVTLFSAATR